MIGLAELLGYLQQTRISPQLISRLPDPGLTQAAAWHDLWFQLFDQPLPAGLHSGLQRHYGHHPDRVAVSLQAGWLLQHPALHPALQAEAVQTLLLQDQPAWLEQVAPASLWRDAERREEWLRLWLRGLSIQLAGESPEVSERRWLQLSSAYRQELFAALRARRSRKAAVRAAQERLLRLETGD